jgi:hypothetical protein
VSRILFFANRTQQFIANYAAKLQKVQLVEITLAVKSEAVVSKRPQSHPPIPNPPEVGAALCDICTRY